MEIYRQKSWWKVVLMIIGLTIIVFTMVYSNYLSKRLAENERKYINFYINATKRINENIKDLDKADFTLELTITENIKNPIIMDDGQEGLLGFNWPDNKDEDQEFLKKQLEKMKNSGIKPIYLDADDDPDTPDPEYPQIYFKYSTLYSLIKWFPYVQVLLIGIFVFFGYMIFSAVRRAEQNRVWVGMSKETAHQLGTPISGIIGWLEYLKSPDTAGEDQKEALQELEKDVKKLELIADRFSKIGSAPVLKKRDINEVIQSVIDYLKKRSPKNIEYSFDRGSDVSANINDHLFSWVIENILRNALDAMQGTGKIHIETKRDGDKILIDITDTGKGIAPGNLKTVFKPGYSTKKRGWGLGLSLAKRIIKDYHKGKIFVLKSKLNEGTTFRIVLPGV